jgi:ABC-2 type transport system permease protein
MAYLRLIGAFARASAQDEMAYRANLGIGIVRALVDMGTGVVALVVLFANVPALRGWDLSGTLALLGVFTVVASLRRLCIGPSLESLAGINGEIWSGRFDYTLLRPVSTQFLASFRSWRPMAAFDLLLGLAVLAAAVARLGHALTLVNALAFVAALAVGMTILYSLLLGLTALVLWSPGFLFTWVFDALFQMARYPVGIYPGWLRLLLTWAVPVGFMVTVPAQALTGRLSIGMLGGGLALAAAFFAGSSALFRFALRRYASASS